MSKTESSPNPRRRETPLWARRYAQSRVLPQTCFFIVFIVVSAALGGLSYFTGVWWRSGHTTLAAVSGTAALAAAGLIVFASIYFSVPRWGGRKMEQWAEAMYHGEGHAGLTDPARMRARRKFGLAAGTVFALCILAEVGLGLAGVVPERLMQPVSALYMVPLLVTLYVLLRPLATPSVLLWPVLYALHAILILSGMFSGVGSVNAYLPIMGYGLLTLLLAHGYNHYALRRLRRAASGR